MFSFVSPLVKGRLIRRYQRFLAEVTLFSGETVIAHCPNTGSLKTVVLPETSQFVWLSHDTKPGRKYPYTLQVVEAPQGPVVVNTQLANEVVVAALEGHHLADLFDYSTYRREVPYAEKSRVDFLLEGPSGRCFLEIKSVTLLEGKAYAFPDAKTVRGQRHLMDLRAQLSDQDQAVLLFLVMRSGGDFFAPAQEIDPVYARLLAEAAAAGVRCVAYQTEITEQGIRLSHQIPVKLPSL